MTEQRQAAGTIPIWTVGDRLRKAREAAGLDQDQLAEIVGMSRRTVSYYETSGADTTRKRIYLNAWAMATGVPLSWLEGDDGPFDRARVSTSTGDGVDFSSSPLRGLRRSA